MTSNYLKGKEARISSFLSDNEFEQIDFVRSLIQHMNHYQLGTIDNDLQVQFEATIFQKIFQPFFQPLLQRDFISQLAKRGMSELAKNILGYLDADSLRNAEQVT